MNWIAALNNDNSQINSTAKSTVDNIETKTQHKTYSLEVFPCPVCNGNLFRKGHRGGYFCLNCTDNPPMGTDIFARGKRKTVPEPVGFAEGAAVPKQKPIRPPGAEWVAANLERLTELGWTPSMLYRDRLPIGLIHLDIFKKQGVRIALEGENIRFEWENATGRTIRQTARPEDRYRIH